MTSFLPFSSGVFDFLRPKSKREISKKAKRPRRATERVLRLETLEDRVVPAGPQLVSILPSLPEDLGFKADVPLDAGETLTVQPSELVFRFSEGQQIDPATLGDSSVLGGIQIRRSGFDGVFGDGNDVVVMPGYIGVVGDDASDPDTSELTNEVVFRFSERLPDDTYQIQIVGAGAIALANIDGEVFADGTDLFQEFTLDLGPQVLSVVPQPVLREKILSVIDAGGLSAGDQVTVSDSVHAPLILEFSDTVATGQSLGDHTYAVELPTNPTSDTVADLIHSTLNTIPEALALDLTSTHTVGTTAISFEGNRFTPRITMSTTTAGTLDVDDGVLTQLSDMVVVYFNTDELNNDPAQGSVATDPEFYRLLDTQGTDTTDDDELLLPTLVEYIEPDPDTGVLARSVLHFETDLPGATYRLQIGSLTENNDTQGAATVIGTISSDSPFSRVSYLGDNEAASFPNSDDIDYYRFDIAGVSGGTPSVTVSVDPDAELDTSIRLLNSAGSPLDTDDSGAEGAADSITRTLGAGTYYIEITSNPVTAGNIGTGQYRLEVTSADPITVNNSDSEFISANDLGVIGANELVVEAEISNETVYLPEFPGASNEPGARELADVVDENTTHAILEADPQIYSDSSLAISAGTVTSHTITVPDSFEIRDLDVYG